MSLEHGHARQGASCTCRVDLTALNNCSSCPECRYHQMAGRCGRVGVSRKEESTPSGERVDPGAGESFLIIPVRCLRRPITFHRLTHRVSKLLLGDCVQCVGRGDGRLRASSRSAINCSSLCPGGAYFTARHCKNMSSVTKGLPQVADTMSDVPSFDLLRVSACPVPS